MLFEKVEEESLQCFHLCIILCLELFILSDKAWQLYGNLFMFTLLHSKSRINKISRKIIYKFTIMKISLL